MLVIHQNLLYQPNYTEKSETDNNIPFQATVNICTLLRYNADGYCLDISTVVLFHQIKHSTVSKTVPSDEGTPVM